MAMRYAEVAIVSLLLIYFIVSMIRGKVIFQSLGKYLQRKNIELTAEKHPVRFWVYTIISAVILTVLLFSILLHLLTNGKP